jgi:hypothetical protein
MFLSGQNPAHNQAENKKTDRIEQSEREFGFIKEQRVKERLVVTEGIIDQSIQQPKKQGGNYCETDYFVFDSVHSPPKTRPVVLRRAARTS